MGNDKKTAIIIGAGPAGLTAAYELLVRTDIKPVIFEMTSHIGGISKTINYKGNRIDIGGHRFFSRSEQIMNWWLNIFPVENGYLKPQELDNIMLVRKRVSRIFFLRKFFDYPVSLNKNTILNLGFIRMLKIGLSYIYASLFPVKEHSLEDFFINRFGKELYSTFFKDYTEKVWGVPCRMIKPEWGAQRIKGLSVKKALLHAVKSIFFRDSSLSQKNTETSLIDQFIYPKFGPGQLWEEVAKIITDKGGEIFLNHRVIALDVKENSIITSKVRNDSGVEREFKGDYFFSTMAVRDLIGAMETVPKQVREVAQGLKYRDFITVGLLLKSLKIKEKEHMIPDNWIYIQESDVKIGRVQIFNNWSPYMVKDEHTVWLGL
ncbi:MAG: NAD(P)-binding protein, partial [Candidatus Eremiobacterota bacterium]